MPRKTLDEVLDHIIRTAPASSAGLREHIERTIAGPSRNACDLALTSLLPLSARYDVLRERVVSAGGDVPALIESNPAFADAMDRTRDDTSAVWGTFKKACMRRRPGES